MSRRSLSKSTSFSKSGTERKASKKKKRSEQLKLTDYEVAYFWAGREKERKIQDNKTPAPPQYGVAVRWLKMSKECQAGSARPRQR